MAPKSSLKNAMAVKRLEINRAIIEALKMSNMFAKFSISAIALTISPPYRARVAIMPIILIIDIVKSFNPFLKKFW